MQSIFSEEGLCGTVCAGASIVGNLGHLFVEGVGGTVGDHHRDCGLIQASVLRNLNHRRKLILMTGMSLREFVLQVENGAHMYGNPPLKLPISSLTRIVTIFEIRK